MLGPFKGRRWALEMAASIGAEAAGLAADKADQRRMADEVGFDAMPDAAGGEGVTGPLNRKG